MAWRQVPDAFDMRDSARVDGGRVPALLHASGVEDVTVERALGERGYTDFVKSVIRGSDGRASGGSAPTLGIIGRLGGLGARPARIGFVSDGDGDEARPDAPGGRRARGDVVVATHVCPHAPVVPRHPVPFMGSPIDGAP